MAIGLQTVPSYHGTVVLGILPLVTAGLSALVHGYRARLGFWLMRSNWSGSWLSLYVEEQEGLGQLGQAVARLGSINGLIRVCHRR